MHCGYPTVRQLGGIAAVPLFANLKTFLFPHIQGSAAFKTFNNLSEHHGRTGTTITVDEHAGRTRVLQGYIPSDGYRENENYQNFHQDFLGLFSCFISNVECSFTSFNCLVQSLYVCPLGLPLSSIGNGNFSLRIKSINCQSSFANSSKG